MSKSENEISLQEEARGVIEDVGKHVHKIFLADLPSTQSKIVFNLTTLEMKDYCVEMTVDGFQVVGEKYDSNDKKGKYPVFETPYSMLDSLSPAYRASFTAQLIMKLNELKEERQKESEDSDT